MHEGVDINIVITKKCIYILKMLGINTKIHQVQFPLFKIITSTNFLIAVSVSMLLVILACSAVPENPSEDLIKSPLSSSVTLPTPTPSPTPTAVPRPVQKRVASERNMNFARQSHTSTLLKDGRVLVAGGSGIIGPIPVSEIYDPSTDMWVSSSWMSYSRSFHTATLLPDGTVLVIGGVSDIEGLDTAEIYDPASDTWSIAGRMNSAHTLHTATVLPDGRILVIGGVDAEGALKGVDYYDPATKEWTTGKDMEQPRGGHTATLLNDGRVLVAGGADGSRLFRTAELYDPNADTWETVGKMEKERGNHRAVLLNNGQVMVTSGMLVSGKCEMFDPDTKEWSPGPSLQIPRRGHTLTVIGEDKYIIVGGGGTSNENRALAEIYNHSENRWDPGGNMTTGRIDHAATLLLDGRVLITGGVDDGGAFKSVEIYDPEQSRWTSGIHFGSWSTGSGMSEERTEHSATLLQDGTVLVIGGTGRLIVDQKTAVGTRDFKRTAEIYNPLTDIWSSIKNMSERRAGHTASLMKDGRILITGGREVTDTDSGKKIARYHSSAEIYNPDTNSWSSIDSMSEERWGHDSKVLPDWKVLITGGQNQKGLISSSEIFDPISGEWTTAAPMKHPRAGHSSVLTNDGLVLVVGSSINTEIYNPEKDLWVSSGDLSQRLIQPEVVVLPNGNVAIVGGFGGLSMSKNVEIWDSDKAVWTVLTNMENGRMGHTATGTASGQILIVGGSLTTAAELLDPKESEWLPAGNLTSSREGHTATLLEDGRILFVGGQGTDGGTLSTIEVYTP